MLTVLGEAIVDLVGEGARRYRAHPGGSPLNVAVGLARLGQPTSLAARLSTDTFGSLFRGHLAKAGVDPRHLVAAPEPSTLAVATLDEAGVASYDFWTEGTSDFQWTAVELAGVVGEETAALHTGSLVTALPPGREAVVDLVRRSRGSATVSYDPNVRPTLLGDPDAARPGIEAMVGLVHLVKVSSEDLLWLYPAEDPVAAARRWAAAGPALVIVTLGGGGAVALTAGAEVHRPAPPVNVVDTVGAGDAFTAGLLGALADRGALGGNGDLAAVDHAAVLDRACLVAALTCARAGADPPTLAEVAAAEAAEGRRRS